MHGAARRPVNRRVNRPVKPLTQGAEGEAEADVAGLGQHRGLAAVAQHTFHLGKHGLGEDLRASQKAGRGWVGGGGEVLGAGSQATLSSGQGRQAGAQQAPAGGRFAGKPDMHGCA